MNHAARSYADSARTAMPPRELEASALIKAAARLQSVADGWPATRDGLDEAVTHNRRLWTILAGAVADEASPLPENVKASVGALANFVFNQSIHLMVDPAPQQLSTLVLINREIAAGLRS